MRDAAIWAYTLETRSSLYYWFDAMPVKTFPAGMNRIQIANLFDGKGDAATFFGARRHLSTGLRCCRSQGHRYTWETIQPTCNRISMKY